MDLPSGTLGVKGPLPFPEPVPVCRLLPVAALNLGPGP